MPMASEMPWGPGDSLTSPSPRAAPCSPPAPPKDGAHACEITCTLGAARPGWSPDMPWAVPTLTVSTCTGGPCLLQKGWGAVKSHRVPTGRAAWTLVTKHPGEWEGTRPMGLREPEGLGCLGPPAHVPVAGQLVGQLEELDQVPPQC